MPKKKRARKVEKAGPEWLGWVRDGAVAAAVFSAPLLWTAPPILGATARQGQALVTALLWLAWVAHLSGGLLVERRLWLTRLSLSLPAGALVLAAAASSLGSVNKNASVLFTLQLLAGAMLFGLVAQRENRRMRAWAASALVLAAVVGGVYGLRSYVFEWAAGGKEWRTFGPFFGTNLFAGFLAIVIPIAVVLAANAKGTPRVCYGFACAVLVAALPLTGSRGGWLAFVAGAVVLCVGAGAALRRARWGIAAAAVAVILLAGMALAVTPLRTRLLSSFSAQEHSNRFRVLTWQGTVSMARHYPVLGSGPGTFEYVFPKYAIAGFTRMAHQNYLQVAAENGLLGLACFLWLLIAMVGSAVKAIARAESRGEGLLAAGCLSGLVAFLAHSMLDYTWFIGSIAATVWLVGGLAAGGYGQSLALQAPACKGQRIWAFGAVVLLLSLLVSFAVRAGMAESLALQGQQAIRAGDGRGAVESFRAAVAWDPGNGTYRRLLAWILGPEDGAAETRNAIALEPTNSVPHAWLARMLRRDGDLEGAKAEFRKAIALNPNFTGAYREMAEMAMLRKNFAEAGKAYGAIARIEQSPYGQVIALEQVVETDYAFAHYGLGLLARGDLRTAQAEFEQALRIIQDFEARGKGMSQLLEQMGQADPSRSADVQLLRGKVLWRLAEVAHKIGDIEAERRFRALAERSDGAAKSALAEEDALPANGNAAN